MQRIEDRLRKLIPLCSETLPAFSLGRLVPEVPDESAADEQIVLPALVGGHIQLWDARPEVPEFTTQTELAEEGHIQAPANLEHTGGGCG